jgi:hypothetical protein
MSLWKRPKRKRRAGSAPLNYRACADICTKTLGGVIAGVVSWSTSANNAAGCGGLTGVTPLALYRDWILKTALGRGDLGSWPIYSRFSPVSFNSPSMMASDIPASPA